jgi:hypothetical protein
LPYFSPICLGYVLLKTSNPASSFIPSLLINALIKLVASLFLAISSFDLISVGTGTDFFDRASSR